MTDSTDLDELWDFDDPALTERRFRDRLPQVAADPPRRLELLTQIARAQGLQRRFDDAHATLDQVQAQLPEATPLVRVRYLLERGRVFNSSKRLEQARPLFAEAWEAAVAAGEAFYAVDAAHMLGIAAPPDEQLAWNLKALALAEQARDERARGWLGSLHNNIGWTYFENGRYDAALDHFKNALARRQAQGQVRETRIARWCVARALRALGQIEEALRQQRALLGEWQQAGGQDGFVSEEIGECLLALGQAEAARPHFAEAHRLLSQDAWLADSEPKRLARLARLAAGGD